jgi:hypothetical protein
MQFDRLFIRDGQKDTITLYSGFYSCDTIIGSAGRWNTFRKNRRLENSRYLLKKLSQKILLWRTICIDLSFENK